jgi:hypothetical protein
MNLLFTILSKFTGQFVGQFTDNMTKHIHASVKNQILDEVADRVSGILRLFLIGLMMSVLFVAGFLFLFYETMHQIDTVGAIQFNAMVIGSLTLTVLSAVIMAIVMKSGRQKITNPEWEEVEQNYSPIMSIVSGFMRGWQKGTYPEAYRAQFEQDFYNDETMATRTAEVRAR